MPSPEIISSPCIGICQLDSQKVCIGCFRSSEEITYWRTYTEEEREQVKHRIEGRLESHEPVKSNEPLKSP